MDLSYCQEIECLLKNGGEEVDNSLEDEETKKKEKKKSQKEMFYIKLKNKKNKK